MNSQKDLGGGDLDNHNETKTLHLESKIREQSAHLQKSKEETRRNIDLINHLETSNAQLTHKI